MKGFAQLLQSAMNARSNGVELAAEKFRNFLLLQFLKAAETKDFPLVFWQQRESALQKFHFLLFLGGVGGNDRREHF